MNGDVVLGVAVRREPSATEGVGDSDVLGDGTQQQQEVHQQQQLSAPVAVGAVAASNVPWATLGVATSIRTG